MSRAFCVPAVFLLFCALVLSIITSVSLPFLPGVDIARSHVTNAAVQGTQGLTEIRFGIWGVCFYDAQNDRTCLQSTRGYNVTITDGNEALVIGSSLTLGLVIHPLAAVITLFAFIFAMFSTHRFMSILASGVSFLAGLVTLIAFAVDIALFASVRLELDKFGGGTTTNPGPGFWLSFVAVVLLFVGGCTVCFACRRNRRLANATDTDTKPISTKKPIWSRFKRQ